MRKSFSIVGVFIFALMVLEGCSSQATHSKTETKSYSEIYSEVPFNMPEVIQPTFPNVSVKITDYGAKKDGVTLNTEAINKAIQSIHSKGGGSVVIPEGLWVTGPIEMLSNVNLHLERNALVVFTDDLDQYPIIKTSFEGLETHRCTSPIYAKDAENIAITGYGVIDGNGQNWRPVKKDKMTDRQWNTLIKSGGVVDKAGKIWYPSEGALKGALSCEDFNNPSGITTEEEWNEIKQWLRPVLLSFIDCNKILLEGVIFKNSPSWCLHPLMCENITIDNVKVSNPWYSQNGDALDIESCKNVLVVNSLFDAGDDAMCIKSGKDEDGRKRGIPTENVILKNNTVLHGHGGFVVGSEMSGGVKNIYVADCTFLGTDVGLRFKSTRGRGGVVENIFINNINMIDIPNEALLFDLFYGGKSYDVTPEVTEETPAFKDIHISNIFCKNIGKAMFFNGIPEMPIKNITVENVYINGAKNGITLSETEQVSLKNVNITPKEKGIITVKKSKNVNINDVLYGEVIEKEITSFE